jgi:hypothetical protein
MVAPVREAGVADKQPLDPVRQLIVDTAERRGMALNELSRRVGKNTAYMHQYLYRGSPRVLPEDVRADVAVLLQIPEADLKAPRDAAREGPGALPPRSRTAASRASLGLVGPLDLPLVPVRTPNKKGETLSQPSENVARPVSLLGVSGAFGVRMRSNDMKGRYRVGDIAYFHPGQAPEPDDAVVIETQDGDRLLGILQTMNDREVRLCSVDGSREERIKRAEIARIAREVGVQRR